MGSYEYHEFRAIDRPLTAQEQRRVSSLSSRAVVSDRHASFEYHYSSFRGDEEELLSSCFDAMFYITSWGHIRLVFSLPARSFDVERVAPYEVSAGDYGGTGVNTSLHGDRVLLSIGLSELSLGWVEGDGWLSPLLPLREELIAGDDRLLYLGWLAAFEHEQLFIDEDEEREREEAPPPAGMNELGPAHEAFAEVFQISAGLLDAAALGSPPRDSLDDLSSALPSYIESLDLESCRALLTRVARGEHLEVSRELRQGTRTLHPVQAPASAPRRTIADLREAARDSARALKRRQREAYLNDLEAREEALWEEAQALLNRRHRRFREPVTILAKLHDLARARGRRAGFEKRVEPIIEANKRSQSFLKHMRDAKLIP